MATNPFDQFDAPAGTPQPIIPRTPAPQTPAQAEGDALGNDLTRQKIGTEKKQQQKIDLDIANADPAQKQTRNALGLLKSAGVDLRNNVDPVADLIKNSTSGMVQHAGAETYGAVTGHATAGMQNIGKLKTIVSDMVLQLTGGGLGNQVSDADREFIIERVGNLADPNVPADQRLAAWEQVKQRMANLTGVPYAAPKTGGDGNSDEHPGAGALDDNQTQAYNAFLAANPKPTGDQLNAFLSKLTGKTVTNGADIARGISEGRGVSTATENLTEQQKVRDRIAAEDKLGIDKQSDADRLLTHGATLNLSDEASGIGNAAANVITSPFTGNFDPVGSYRLGRDVERQRIDDARQRLGYGGSAIEFIGNLASGNPESAASKITGVRDLVIRGAKGGGAYGAVAGYGQGEGGEESLVGAGLGGATGATIGALGGRFLSRKEPPPAGGEGPGPADIANALDAEGIPAARPIADPSKRGAMAYLETTRGGHAPVRDSLEMTRQSIADKVSGLAGPGEALTSGGMGEAVQEAGKRTIDGMKAKANALYTRAANAAGRAPIIPTDAVATLDQNIAELARNPNNNKGVLSYLKSVRQDLLNGEKTVADIRDIRTGMNGEINRRNLGKTNAERIMGDVLQAARSDIERDLGGASPEALGLYRQADDLWQQMSATRKQVLEKLVGPADNPVSGEQTMSRLRNMMGSKGDAKRFERAMNMLDDNERQNFAATLFNNIGQRSAEEPFSPAYFLSQTKDMQAGALRTVFGDDGARSIQNLRVAARGFTDAQGALNNSRSGFVANFKDAVSSLINLRSTLGGGIGFVVGGPPGAVAGAVAGEATKFSANRLSAKALMNPDVSSWIRKVAAAKSSQQARALVGKLDGIAASNAGIQGEITGFRDAIVRAMNDNAPNAGRAAASPDQRPDQQQ